MPEESRTAIRLDKFKPRPYQVPVFKAIEEDGYKKGILVWARRCLAEDTNVLMADRSLKPLRNIKPGEMVLSFDGNKFVPDLVVDIWNAGEKETKKITYGPLCIIASHDHRFYSLSKRDWVYTSKISPQDKLLTYDQSIEALPIVEEYKKTTTYDLQTEKNHNFIANGFVVHNSGKDFVCLNLVIRQAITKPGVYYIVFPTYAQGKKAMWDSMSNDGIKFLDYIPKEIITSMNSCEMKVSLFNGSLIQVVGADNIDRIVGTNPRGIIFSEASLQDIQRNLSFLRPILMANNGWFICEGTPRSRNGFYDLYKIALANPDEWFSSFLTIKDTGHISEADVQAEIDRGEISEDLAAQEYYNSFSQGVDGAYYVKYIDRMREENRITTVPWDPALKVHTSWDLGVRDSTVIVFFQYHGNAMRIIDCVESSDKSLEYYIKIVKEKPYVYGTHIAPHDIRVREFTTGMSRIEKALQLGIDFYVAPSLSIMDGIEAVRTMIPRMWIDERLTDLIKALEGYHKEFDHKRKIYNPKPAHNQSSHICDAIRCACLSINVLHEGSTKEQLEALYLKAAYGRNQYN